MTDGRRDVLLDSASAGARERHRERFAARGERLRALCRRHGMSLIPVATDADLAACLRSELPGPAAA